MSRLVQAGSACGCVTLIIDYDSPEEVENCELGFSGCELEAIAILRSAFWEPRPGGRYCFACQPYALEHAKDCRAFHGTPKED